MDAIITAKTGGQAVSQAAKDTLSIGSCNQDVVKFVIIGINQMQKHFCSVVEQSVTKWQLKFLEPVPT